MEEYNERTKKLKDLIFCKFSEKVAEEDDINNIINLIECLKRKQKKEKKR